MKLIYGFLSIVSIMYILFRHRKIDFFTVYILSVIIYYFPAYLGIIYMSKGNYIDISNQTYVVICINILITLGMIILYDIIGNRRNEHKQITHTTQLYYNKAVVVVCLLTIALNFISIIQYGGINGPIFNKSELLANSNRFIAYAKYLTLFVFVYGFTNRGKHILFIRITGSLSMLYTFLLGHRSFLVLGIIGVIYTILLTKYKFKNVFEIVRKNKKMVISILIFTLFIFFIKGVFAALKNGNYELVKFRLSSKEYYIETMLQSEPNVIVNNLNNVLKYNVKYNFVDYITNTIFCMVPFLGNALINSFNIQTFEKILQITFNDKLSEGIGIGSTFLGESYATGGYFLLILNCILICFLIIFLENRLYKTKNPANRVWFMIFLTYSTFYLSRNSFVFILISARAYLYILVIVWILKFLIKVFYNQFRVRNNIGAIKNCG